MTLEISKQAREIARRLHLHRPLAFLDLETTGSSPELDRIVEVAIFAIAPRGATSTFYSLVNPQRPIPDAASSIHGISNADVRDAPPFSAIASKVSRALKGCDLAGFNIIRFDLRLLVAEFRNAGVAFTYDDVCVVDSMQIFHKKEPRDLSAAARFYLDREHRGHRARRDVAAALEIFDAQLARYSDLPRSVEELDRFCRDRRPDWLTNNGQLIWTDGRACFAFGRHAGQPLEEVLKNDPQYLEWLQENDFPDDFKRIIGDALDGVLPRPPRPAASGRRPYRSGAK